MLGESRSFFLLLFFLSFACVRECSLRRVHVFPSLSALIALSELCVATCHCLRLSAFYLCSALPRAFIPPVPLVIPGLESRAENS